MIIPLIILILIFIIAGYITGNFLFNLALNPKSSKSIIFNNETDEIKFQMKIDNTKWLEENAKEVYIEDKKIKEIRESCRKKDKNKVISFLKEIAMGTGTNLIATGILAMFGLM